MRIVLTPGETIDEVRLVAELNLSRTPVREALIKLLSEGLVIREGRSLRVAQMDITDFPVLFESLDFFSRANHRLAAVRHNGDDIEEIGRTMLAFEKACVNGGAASSEANHEFHMSIAAATHNEYVMYGYERALNSSIRLARLCFGASGYEDDFIESHLETTIKEHRKIFESIRDRDPDEAEHNATEHTQLFRGRVDAMLKTRDAGLSTIIVPSERGGDHRDS